jgi:transcriptional regulator of arginine metabolism
MHLLCIAVWGQVGMQKAERQKKILAVIQSEELSRQDEIVQRLSEDGFTVTQASVSRDLDELGITKVSNSYRVPDPTNSNRIFDLTSIEPAGDNLIVARCASGLASAAAVMIDAARITQIIGTIAGDDTIFIAVKGQTEQRTARKKIMELFQE